jgi:hypothetical protein
VGDEGADCLFLFGVHLVASAQLQKMLFDQRSYPTNRNPDEPAKGLGQAATLIWVKGRAQLFGRYV